jgi:epoxide hydrolase A/B
MTIERNFEMVEVGEVTLRVVVEGEGPLVVFVHGWPESWYSWRHQIDPVVAAGFTVAVPDVRGYGGSDRPHPVEAYDMASMVGDVLGLIDGLGHERALLVGHDWGAPIVWSTTVTNPDRIGAVCAMSVPYLGRGEAPFIDVARALYADRFFYQIYFQDEGVAEAELEADVRDALGRIYLSASADRPDPGFLLDKGPDATLLEGLPFPDPMPGWLSDEDLDYYASQFEEAGFRGGLNRYRNQHRDWEAAGAIADPTISTPAWFVCGDRDIVLEFIPGVDLVDAMRPLVPGLEGVTMVPDAGHWVQQEAAEATNAALVPFLAAHRDSVR